MGDRKNPEKGDRHTVGTTTDGVIALPRRVADSAFWREQAARLESLREQALRHSKRPLGAGYHPDGWGLDNVRAFHGRGSGRWLLEDGTEAIAEEFKSVAGLCAVATGVPNTDAAWTDWLDYLRRDSLDFEPDEFVSESWAHERRPEPTAEVSAPGLVSPPVEVRPDANVQLVSHELGGIKDVCASSAHACRRIADETMKLELQPVALRREGTPLPSALSDGSGWTVTQSWETELVPSDAETLPLPTVDPSESVVAARRQRVVRLLEARGWSTLDWAKAANVDYHTANDCLNGSTNPRRDTLKKLADALEVSPADLT